MNDPCQMRDVDWDSLALGGLEEAERLILEAHLRSGCEVCRSLYANSLSAALAMAASLPGQAPSQTVEDRLAAHVRKGKFQAEVIAMPVRPKRNWAPWMVAAASLAVAGWFGTRPVVQVARPVPVLETVERRLDPNPQLVARIAELEGQLRAKPVGDPRLAELQQQLEEARRPLATAPTVVRVEDPEKDRQLQALRMQLKEMEQQLQTQQRLVAEAQNGHREVLQGREKKLDDLSARLVVLEAEGKAQRRMIDDYRRAFRSIESSGVKQVELARVDPAAQQSGARALYSPQGGLLLLAHDLPKLSEQKCYQLWILRKGSPAIVSGGLIQLDGQGHGFLQSAASSALKDATGFAITDEPVGGSVVARGRKLLFGAL